MEKNRKTSIDALEQQLTSFSMMSPAEAFERFGLNNDGLNAEQIEKGREKYGENVISTGNENSIFTRIRDRSQLFYRCRFSRCAFFCDHHHVDHHRSDLFHHFLCPIPEIGRGSQGLAADDRHQGQCGPPGQTDADPDRGLRAGRSGGFGIGRSDPG